jgi:hypothetical protein
VDEWVFLVVLWVASAFGVGLAVRPTSDHRLIAWSIRFNVLLQDDTRPLVATRLRRARAIRWTSFIIGVNVGMLPMYMNVIDVERAGSFNNPVTAQAPFIAAALGCVLAEVTIVHRRSGPRSAVLVRRRWSDYVLRLWIGCIVACLPISLVAVAIGPWNDRSRWLWVGPAASAIAIAATTAGVTLIVNRPPIEHDDAFRRIDDALRADGAQHVVGASLALAGIATLNTVALVVPPIVGLLLALSQYLVIGCWYGIIRDRWNVEQARLQHA